MKPIFFHDDMKFKKFIYVDKSGLYIISQFIPFLKTYPSSVLYHILLNKYGGGICRVIFAYIY